MKKELKMSRQSDGSYIVSIDGIDIIASSLNDALAYVRTETYSNSLPQQIIKYRAENDISQSVLANLAGVSRETISKAESGVSVSSLTEQKIRMVLNGEEDGEK